MIPPNPFDARLVFMNGPLALYVHKATREEINHAYNCLGRYLTIACDQFDLEDSVQAQRPLPSPPNASWGSPDGEGP